MKLWRVTKLVTGAAIAVVVMGVPLVKAQTVSTSSTTPPSLPTSSDSGLVDPGSSNFSDNVFFDNFNSGSTTSNTSTSPTSTTTTPATTTTTPTATTTTTPTTTHTTTSVSDVAAGPTDQLLFWGTFLLIFSGFYWLIRSRKSNREEWL